MKTNSLMTSMLSIPFMIFSLYLMNKNTFISLEFSIMKLQNFNFQASLILDWFSCLFIFTVLFISSMIMYYSNEYIPQKEQKQFLMILIMFITSMFILILSNNMMFMLLGWDGLGLSSYILVVYYQNPSSSASGTITILSNRVGDILILMSISLMMSLSSWEFILNEKYNTNILMMIMFAACTKSAQFPFSAWLPAAMAAPTPISALVHSSTLVTAGVYLMMRIMNNIHPNMMLTLMVISSFTALYSSMSASWEQDMKKIIALSTLSQISMMMFSLSMGAMNLAFIHLIIHALFKSMMFLCAGILIHNSSYQDMRHMGSLMNNAPLTSTIMGIATMALMGFPFMSGFFSKDPIIELLIMNSLTSYMIMLMILSIGMTSMYSTRLIKMAMSNFLKSKPDMTIQTLKYMELPIMLMAPTSIMMGTTMMWMSNPTQIFIIPNNMKISIILSLILGSILSLMLNFKSKKFMKFSEAAISLWFSHNISTFPTKNPLNIMNTSLKTDKTWKEYLGPNNLFIQMNNQTKFNNKISQSLMSTLLMISLIPSLSILFN